MTERRIEVTVDPNCTVTIGHMWAEVIVWIAEDGSGDLFFDGDKWAQGRTRDRVTFPMAGSPSSRTFVRTPFPVHLHTADDFPLWRCLDPEDELPRLARWKALHWIARALSKDDLSCRACRQGDLIPDGERLRCLRCEHGPSDWQRRPR